MREPRFKLVDDSVAPDLSRRLRDVPVVEVDADGKRYLQWAEPVDDVDVWRDETDPNRANFDIPIVTMATAAANAWADAIERACEVALARVGGAVDRCAMRMFEGEAWRTQIVIDNVPAYEIRGTWDEYRFSVTTTEIL